MTAKTSLGMLLLGVMLTIERVSGACGNFYTAQSGDTCASIAASSSITVSEFLRNNPSVTQCDGLIAGSQYCVDSSAPSALRISDDGQCGGEYTCVGSSFGECCSPHGW